MKETKRALRRHQKRVKLLQRINIWVKDLNYWKDGTKEEFVASVLRGETHTWMRTTSSACNCFMCSGEYKYKRERKQYIDFKID